MIYYLYDSPRRQPALWTLAVVRYRVTIRYTIAHYGTGSPSFLPSALYHPLTSVYSPFVGILPYIWRISTLYSVLPFGSHTSSLWSGIVLVSIVFPLVPSFPPLSVCYPLALTHTPFGRPKYLCLYSAPFELPHFLP